MSYITGKPFFYTDFKNINLKTVLVASQISQSKFAIPKILDSYWLILGTTSTILILIFLKLKEGFPAIYDICLLPLKNQSSFTINQEIPLKKFVQKYFVDD